MLAVLCENGLASVKKRQRKSIRKAETHSQYAHRLNQRITQEKRQLIKEENSTLEACKSSVEHIEDSIRSKHKFQKASVQTLSMSVTSDELIKEDLDTSTTIDPGIPEAYGAWRMTANANSQIAEHCDLERMPVINNSELELEIDSICPFEVSSYTQQIQYAHHEYCKREISPHVKASSAAYTGSSLQSKTGRSGCHTSAASQGGLWRSVKQHSTSRLWARNLQSNSCPSSSMPSQEFLARPAHDHCVSEFSNLTPSFISSAEEHTRIESPRTQPMLLDNTNSSPWSDVKSRLPKPMRKSPTRASAPSCNVRGPITPSMRSRYSNSHLARKNSKPIIRDYCLAAKSSVESDMVGQHQEADVHFSMPSAIALERLKSNGFSFPDVLPGVPRFDQLRKPDVENCEDLAPSWEKSLRLQLAEWTYKQRNSKSMKAQVLQDSKVCSPELDAPLKLTPLASRLCTNPDHQHDSVAAILTTRLTSNSHGSNNSDSRLHGQLNLGTSETELPTIEHAQLSRDPCFVNTSDCSAGSMEEHCGSSVLHKKSGSSPFQMQSKYHGNTSLLQAIR